MKKILLAALTALISITAQAGDDDEYGLYVVTSSGTSTTAVSVLQKITFSNGTVVVEQTDGTKASTSMSDISRMYFAVIEEDDHLKGDVNEDGEIDIKDVVAVINHMAGTDSWRYANVNEDTDDDGNDIVDINDVVAVINIMAGNE